MRINFRQGIITYPSTGVNQNFLVSGGGFVSLRASLGRVDLAFAQGNSNYLLTESTDVDNAWGPLPISTDCWLYVDINPLTGERTFGFTTTAPVIGSIAPAPGVAGLSWFDTASTTMYEFTGATTRRAVIRVFVAKVNNNAFSPLGTGIPSKPFAGTQVGISGGDVSVGRIIADDTGRPIRRPSGTLFTTEDDFFIDGSPVNVIRIDATVVNGEALENMAKFQVVKFSEFGKLELAGYNDTQTTAIAMLLEDLNIQEVGTVCIQGKVSNPDWNWTTVGAELWIEENGLLTETDPHVSNSFVFPVPKPAVARVITPDTVIFDQGLGGKGERGAPGLSGGVDFATPVVYGVARLSVPAADNQDPVVVGTNDPRLNDKVFRSGDTMTGPLILSGNPTVALGAATKQYIDTRVLDDLANVSVLGAVSGNGLVFNGTNWVAGTVSGGGATTLDELTDVDTAGVVAGDALVFDGAGWVPGTPTDTVFVFQVGVFGATEHYHYAPLSAAEAQFLISGTSPTLPVGDVGQPTVVISAIPNANPLEVDHTHDVIVAYDYTQQTFVSLGVTDNGTDNHIALLVGKGGSGGGDSAWTVQEHIYAPEVTFATASFHLFQGGSILTVEDVLPKPMDLVLGDLYTVALSVDGVAQTYNFIATGIETVQTVIDTINASPLNQYATVSVEFVDDYTAAIVYTAVEEVIDLTIIDAGNGSDPFFYSGELFNQFYGYEMLAPTQGIYFIKVAQGLQPVTGQVGEPTEVYLTIPTYAESNPISPIIYDTWTASSANADLPNGYLVGRAGIETYRPTGVTEDVVYSGGTVQAQFVNAYGNDISFAYIDARFAGGLNGGNLVDFGVPELGLYRTDLFFQTGGTWLRGLDVGPLGVNLLVQSYTNHETVTRMSILSYPHDLSGQQASISYVGNYNVSHGMYEDARHSMATDRTSGEVAAVFLLEDFNTGDTGFTLVKLNSSLVPIWSFTTTPFSIVPYYSNTEIDPDTGDVFVMISSGFQPSFTYLARFASATGAPIWEQTFPNESPFSNIAGTGLVIDPVANRLYIGGSVHANATGDGIGDRVGLVASLNATTGVAVWIRQIDVTPPLFTTGTSENLIGKLAFDGTFLYYSKATPDPVDSNKTGILLVCLDTTGAQVWSRFLARSPTDDSAYYSQFELDTSYQYSAGDITVNDTTLFVSFTVEVPSYPQMPKMVIAALDKTGPAIGSNFDQFVVTSYPVDVIDIIGTFPARNTAPLAVAALNTPSLEESVSFVQLSQQEIRRDLASAVRAPGPGVVVDPIEPSVEVANLLAAGSLKLGDLLPPPDTLVGNLRDERGMLRVDQTGVFYCFADYDGSSIIWKRLPFDDTTLVFNYVYSNITALPEHAGNIVLMSSFSTPLTYYIPEDDSTFPVGTTIVVGQDGNQQVTIQAEDSYTATIRTPETNRTRKQYAKVTLIKTAPNQWDLEGNLELFV